MARMKRRVGVIIGIVAVIAIAGGIAYWRYATREPRKSQPASVMQAMGDTRIEIHYNRPTARGRALFGGIVPYGQVWDPGADEATTFATNRSISFAGQSLAAGTYSVWAIPDSAEWTVILSRAAHVYHIPYPDGRDALRVRVPPTVGPYVETLMFSFPTADAIHAQLVLAWGTTRIVIPIATR